MKQLFFIFTTVFLMGATTVFAQLNTGSSKLLWYRYGSSHIYRPSGNVGIGINNPNAPLHIKFGDKEQAGFRFGPQYHNYQKGETADFLFQTKIAEGYPQMDIYTPSWGADFSWTVGQDPQSHYGGEYEAMTLHARPWPDENGYYPNTKLTLRGRMGINTQVIGNYTLAVNGTIGCKKIVATLTDVDWPDYVFDKDYTLMQPLEIEQFIAKNGHLPDMPSAQDIQDKGQDIAQLNMLLLKKVEELTLLLIQQQKEIEQLKAKQ